MSSFRLVWDGLHHRLTATVTSEAVGFSVHNLFDGSRHSFWRATGTGDQVIMWDAGAGNTEAVDTTVIARADLLVAVAAHVSTQWSDDAATGWTDTYTPKTPLLTSHLLKPTDQDFYIEHPALLAKRGWRLRLYGTPSAPASCALVWLGKRLDVERSPGVGPGVGLARPHMGAAIEVGWPVLTAAGLQALLTALVGVSRAWPAEGRLVTRAGTGYGSRPHFLYDAGGSLFRVEPAPALAHVQLVTPDLRPQKLTPTLWSLGAVGWEQSTA